MTKYIRVYSSVMIFCWTFTIRLSQNFALVLECSGKINEIIECHFTKHGQFLLLNKALLHSGDWESHGSSLLPPVSLFTSSYLTNSLIKLPLKKIYFFMCPRFTNFFQMEYAELADPKTANIISLNLMHWWVNKKKKKPQKGQMHTFFDWEEAPSLYIKEIKVIHNYHVMLSWWAI